MFVCTLCEGRVVFVRPVLGSEPLALLPMVPQLFPLQRVLVCVCVRVILDVLPVFKAHHRPGWCFFPE